MSGARGPMRLGLWIPWGLFAAAALGWLVYWNVLKDRALARIEAVAAEWRSAGGVAEWRAVGVDGFPLRLSYRFEDLRIGGRGGAWTIAAPRASLHVNPADPLHVIGAPDAPLTVTTPRGAATASAREAGFSLRLRRDGGLVRASVEAQDFVWRSGSGRTRAARLLASARPDPRDANALQIALELDAFEPATIPPALSPLGARIDRVRAALVVEMLDAIVRAGADGWAKSGAGVRIEAGELGWGPAKAKATGRLTLDDRRRLAGAVTLTIADPPAAIGPLATAPGLSAAARTALATAAAAPAPLALPLDLTGGVLSYAGLAPLIRFTADPSTQGPSK